MSNEKKGGHGSSATHGHGHTAIQTNRKHARFQTGGTSKQNKSKQTEPAKEIRHNGILAVADNDVAVMRLEETVTIPPYHLDEDKKYIQEEVDGKMEEKYNGEEDSKAEDLKKEKVEYKKSNVTPENFNVKEFNTNMTEFIRTLDDPRYCQVDSEYPVEDLVSVVGMVTKSINDYSAHSSDTQRQLTDLSETMKTIKENLYFSVTRQALDLKADENHQTQEERELYAKMTHLNAVLAKASADVTEAIRLASEAEATAVKANIAAEKAKSEAKRIKEEAEKKEKAEQIRRENEKKRAAEERRQKEEQYRKIQEEKRRVEEEWKRVESIQAGKVANSYESWQPIEYAYTNKDGETEITCIARGKPGSFEKQDVIFNVSNEKEALVTYQPDEELISNVVDLTSANGEVKLKSPVYVAIPHVLSRSGAQSREAVVKALSEGEWKDLPTRDVTFDSHKETKFAQAEVRHLTTLIIVSRLKRDYATLGANKDHKLTSSCDQRITLNIEKNTFERAEHFLLQVQPIDSGTFNEFRTRQPNGKRLLSCSPVIHTKWESTSFNKPVEVTVSCPPNPAKAKKMALARKLKEEKMKNPPNKPLPIEEQEKEKAKKKIQEFMEVENRPAKVNKWYMGEYGHSDDDETDKLNFVYMIGGKWLIDPNLLIKQVKVDVLLFRLEFPVERFIVLRIRTTLEEDSVVTMAASLNDFLGKRFVEAVIRQKSDNPCEVALQMTPVSRLDAVVKQLAQKGFETGPAPSHVICLQEGDMVEVEFIGNIECTDELPEKLIYKSNISTVTYFVVKEENKFRQKEQDFYSGLIQLTRCYTVTPSIRVQKIQGSGFGQGLITGQSDENHQLTQKEWKREKLCTIQVNIPKYHVEPNTEPKKAPVSIAHNNGPVDSDLLMSLAASLGDEWKRVAHYLGVHRVRIQAIMRNVTIGERSERDAKYEMLVTWLKGAAKALDKVSALSSALKHSDRYDLAEEVQDRNRDFIELKRGQLTVAN